MSVSQILTEFGQKMAKELATTLSSNSNYGGRIFASGALSKSVRFGIKILGDEFVFKLEMEDYWRWVDEGRKPGKFPNLTAIRKWANTPYVLSKLSKRKDSRFKKKGLKVITTERLLSDLIGGVMGNIKKKGIKPTHFFSDVYDDEALLDLKKNLSAELKREVIIELTQA